MTTVAELRWVEGPLVSDAEWRAWMDKIDPILAARGWMSLNKRTARILVAEDADGSIRGFLVQQFVPHVGPVWTRPSDRGTGLAEQMADDMIASLLAAKARGWVVIADSPFVGPLCEARGMERLTSPVYVAR